MTAAPRAITLKADIANLDSLFAFIGEDLDAGGCPQKERGQIELAAEEIFVNIVNYAYHDNNNTEYIKIDSHVRLLPEKMVISLAFTDYGRPFNPLEQKEPDISVPLKERKIGGLGLLIVKKTMDTILYSYEGGANRLEFSKSWQRRNNGNDHRSGENQ